MIKDSGARRTFNTGAVRDIQDSKGRPSLMPFRVAARMLRDDFDREDVMTAIGHFFETRDTQYLYHALDFFSELAFDGSVPTMLLEVSVHFEEGALKYGENNWQKGIPVECYMDSAIRHYLKYKRGDQDEPHDRAFVWNLMCCIWEVDCRTRNENFCVCCGASIPEGKQYCSTCWENANGGS